MSRRIITISFTGLNDAGGVPAFNRALHAVFPDRECLHFCWTDHPYHRVSPGLSEWDRARILNAYLVQSQKIISDDVVIADGFWANGLSHLPLAVSHSHGIWSHLTKEDVDVGKPPDMPLHHLAQVAFRKRWTDLGKHITAVSDFIAEQMRLQWGFQVDRVINNGVDTEKFHPMPRSSYRRNRRPLVIHGVNDRGNLNKGWDHVKLLTERLDADVMSLDEAYELFTFYSDRPWEKHEVLSQADVVVHPSGYEGNSMFVAEALASGVPVVGYDVGYLWKIRSALGVEIIPRTQRSPETTLDCVETLLSAPDLLPTMGEISRAWALKDLSIEGFRQGWRSYVEEIERDQGQGR